MICNEIYKNRLQIADGMTSYYRKKLEVREHGTHNKSLLGCTFVVQSLISRIVPQF